MARVVQMTLLHNTAVDLDDALSFGQEVAESCPYSSASVSRSASDV
jgi:hypothetical protein